MSKPQDPAEREASRLAAPLARGERVSVVEAAGPRLHRDCAACWSGSCACEQPIFREIEGDDASGELSSDDIARFHGAPLADDVRAPLEQQLGADLSQVRVDDSPAASEAARKIHARAFTVGKQIMFSRDAFRPDTLHGLELLTHELVHVAQQARGGGAAIHRDDDDDAKTELELARGEYDEEEERLYDEYENEPLGLTKAGLLRRWLLYTMAGPPNTRDDVIAADQATADYEDEEKSIKKLGKDNADLIDLFPEAFPSTWADRLEPVMVLPFHISFAEADRDKAWTSLQSISTAMPSTLYPIGLPIPDFDEALHLKKFQVVKTHSGLNHPVGWVAAAGNWWLEKQFIVDTRNKWLVSAKRYVSLVRDGKAAVAHESFLKYKMYIGAIEHPDRAVESDITIDQAFGKIPADLQEVDTVMAKVSAWLAFLDWFIGWPPVGDDFQRGLALVDDKIAGTNRFAKLWLGQSWADRWGYSEEAWNRIKEEFLKALPDMLKEAGLFIALQFVPGVDILVDIYTIGSAVIDFIGAAWDTADAADAVMSSKKVVDLQRTSAELGFKGRANALRIAGDLLAIKASMKAMKMRAAKAHATTPSTAPKSKGPKVKAPAPHVDVDPKFAKWKSTLSKDTLEFLENNPNVEALFAATDEGVREVLKLCNSPCTIPKASTPRQHARIKDLIDKGKIDPKSKAAKEYFHKHVDDLDRAIDDVANAQGSKAVDKVLASDKARPPLVAGKADHKLQRWRDYQDANPKKFAKPSDTIDPKWSKQYDTIIANKKFGSAFEREGLEMASNETGSNFTKNDLVMINDGAESGGFIPDGVVGPNGGKVTSLEWGKPYHFCEIKGWNEMSMTGNLAAMIAYVESVPGSKITVVFKDTTSLSAVLEGSLGALADSGRATIHFLIP